MSNLNFYKGEIKSLPDKNNRQKHSFYFVEDIKDFYYTNNNNDLIKLFANPEERIIDMKTFYSLTTNQKPHSYPPSTDWSSERPETFGNGQPGYYVNCILYLDEHYEYLDVIELITDADIDFICQGANYSTSKLSESALGRTILNLREEEK